jgi:O-antigen/teichoic acid export membrane protein
MVGQFALGLAITTPIVLFANLQLSGIEATDVLREYDFTDYLSLRLITSLSALSGIALIALASNYKFETALVVLIIGLMKTLDAVGDVFLGLLQQRERMARIAVAWVVNGTVSLGLLTIAVWLTRSMVWGAVGTMCGSAITLIFFNVRNAAGVLTDRGGGSMDLAHLRALRPSWNGRRVARLVLRAIPLGFAALFVSLNANVSRYFIQHYWGERSLGFFAAVIYLLTAGNSVSAALGQSALPRLARYWAIGNLVAFRSLVVKLIAVAILMGGAGIALAMIVGPELLAFVYRPEYAEHAQLLVWIMAAAAIGYVSSSLGYAVNATRAFGRLVAPYGLVTAVSVAACFWLVPRHGLIGAAWAVGLTNIAACGAPLFVFAGLKREQGWTVLERC